MVFAGVLGFASGDARFPSPNHGGSPLPNSSVPLFSSSIWDEGRRGRMERQGWVRGAG